MECRATAPRIRKGVKPAGLFERCRFVSLKSEHPVEQEFLSDLYTALFHVPGGSEQLAAFVKKLAQKKKGSK